MGISATAQWATELSFAVILVLYLVFRWAVNTWLPHLSRGKRAALMAAWVAFCVLISFASHWWKAWYIAPNGPYYVSAEAAAADGCVVILQPELMLDGEEHWADFLQSVNMGLPDFLRLAMVNGEIRQVDELVFDGVGYSYVDRKPFKHHKEETESYPYLLNLSSDPDPAKGMWVLTDKADLTRDELERTMGDPRRGYEYRLLWDNEYITPVYITGG